MIAKRLIVVQCVLLENGNMQPSKAQHVVKCTSDDVWEDRNGGCLECGHLQRGGVEPDARFYKCRECGHDQVFGLAELATMGRLDVDDANSDDDSDWDDFDSNAERLMNDLV